MAPPLVAVAAGALLGVALLGPAFDRRSLAVVTVAAAAPDLDSVFALVGPGAPGATLHSAFVPLAAAAALYLDTERGGSRLRERIGARGVRTAWVAVAAYAVAGIGLDAVGAGAAFAYPLSGHYYAVEGRLLLSTQEGVIQTYLTLGEESLGLVSRGRVGEGVVDTWLRADGGERRLTLVESGWQAVLVATAAAAIPAKALVERADREGGG